jgi:hypothetical protein
LLNQGFSGFQHRQIIRAGEIVGFVEIAGGLSGNVQLLAAVDFAYALAPEEQVTFVAPGAGFVYAPVARGADAGFIYICVNGKAVGKVPVTYGETIELQSQQERSFWARLIGGD